MKKRTLIALFCFTALVAAIPAFSQAARKVTVTFWHNYGADAETPYFNNTIVPLFQAQYPNIDLKVVAQGSDQYNNLLITAIGTHTAPDVARVDLMSLMNYAKLGGVLPLDGMKGFVDLKGKLLEAPLSTNLYHGKYYGLPLDTNCKVAVINMNNLGTLGFSQPPKTLEELIAAARKGGAGKPVINVSSASDWDLLPYFWMYGGVVTDAGFTKASGYLDSARSVDAMKQLAALHSDGILTIKEIDGSTDAWDGIQMGEYGMFLEGPWFFGFIKDYKSKGIVPAPIPTYKGSSASIVGGESVAVFKDSKNPDAAFELVKFLLSDQVQVLMGVNMGQMPVVKSVANNPQFAGNPVWSIYLKQLATAKARIPSPQRTAIEQAIKDAFDSILRGKAKPEDALHTAAQLIDAAIAK